MNTANIIAIVAAVVSFGSMCAAIASAATARKNARIAGQAKEQARRAATLERRAKAIEHLRRALRDIENDGRIVTNTVHNIHEAQLLSELVFDNEVQAAIAKAHDETQRLHRLIMPPNDGRRSERDVMQDTRELEKDLKDLLSRMTQEAALGQPSKNGPAVAISV